MGRETWISLAWILFFLAVPALVIWVALRNRQKGSRAAAQDGSVQPTKQAELRDHQAWRRTGPPGLSLPPVEMVFEVKPSRFSVVITQVFGWILLVSGLLTLSRSVFSDGDQDGLFAGLAFALVGGFLVWLKRPIKRQLLAVNHSAVTYQPAWGRTKSCHISQVVSLKAQKSEHGGLMALDLNKKTLFYAQGNWDNYNLLIDWFEEVRPDLAMPWEAQP